MTTPGEWQEWSAGKDYRGWTLECGRLVADIRQQGDGRRGIVLMKTFNETPPDNNDQWTIDPQDGRARGIAFLCQGYKN